MMPYERFHAWQACDALVIAVYRVTGAFPRHELYGLTSQARRAAFSAAANIAEGSAKRGPREFRRYLDIAIGSLSELSYTIRLALKLGYVPEAEWQELDRLHGSASRLTWRLYESLGKKRVTPNGGPPDRPTDRVTALPPFVDPDDLRGVLPALIVLIVLKTTLDLAAHLAERRKLGPTP